MADITTRIVDSDRLGIAVRTAGTADRPDALAKALREFRVRCDGSPRPAD